MTLSLKLFNTEIMNYWLMGKHLDLIRYKLERIQIVQSQINIFNLRLKYREKYSLFKRSFYWCSNEITLKESITVFRCSSILLWKNYSFHTDKSFQQTFVFFSSLPFRPVPKNLLSPLQPPQWFVLSHLCSWPGLSRPKTSWHDVINGR